MAAKKEDKKEKKAAPAVDAKAGEGVKVGDPVPAAPAAPAEKPKEDPMEKVLTQLELVVDNLKKLFPAFADGVTAITEAAVVQRETADKVTAALEAAVAAGVKIKGEKKKKEKPAPAEGEEGDGEGGEEGAGEGEGETSGAAAEAGETTAAAAAPAEEPAPAAAPESGDFKVDDVVVLDWKKKGTLHFAIFKGRAENGEFTGVWKKDAKKPFQCPWDWLSRPATAEETKEVLSK